MFKVSLYLLILQHLKSLLPIKDKLFVKILEYFIGAYK